MALVCLSHVRLHLDSTAPLLYEAVTVVTRIATPTFLLLSGFVASYVLRTSASPRRAAITLVDRGLFLLLVAHLLLNLADLSRVDLFEWLFVRTSITDVIGVALCLAVLFRNRSAGMLITLGGSAFLVSWIIGATLVPQTAWSRHLGALLFSIRNQEHKLVDVAMIPYIGMFLIGMGLSTAWRQALADLDCRTLARRCLLVGGAGVALALSLALTWYVFTEQIMMLLREPHLISLARVTIHPLNKHPPSPGYLLFYGGAGLVMAGVYFLGQPRRLVQPIVSKAAVLGRASLMCFVVQDWLLFVTPRVFGFEGLTSPAFWMTYFFGVLLALYILASAWNRAHGNRFLTIGLKRLLLRRAEGERRAPAPVGSDAAAARR